MYLQAVGPCQAMSIPAISMQAPPCERYSPNLHSIPVKMGKPPARRSRRKAVAAQKAAGGRASADATEHRSSASGSDYDPVNATASDPSDSSDRSVVSEDSNDEALFGEAPKALQPTKAPTKKKGGPKKKEVPWSVCAAGSDAPYGLARFAIRSFRDKFAPVLE